MTGNRIGPYEIGARLGAGGMGEVYRARDAKLDRDVAIKVLPPALASDAERIARFEREARTLAALNHPHIAQIYGVEEQGPTRALVMELVEGPTLADLIASAAETPPLAGVSGPSALRPAARGRPGGLGVPDAISIARQIADGLESAHDAGIVHRDLKPANVKVRPDGIVKVLDFGLAKLGAPAAAPGARSSTGALVESPTMTSPVDLTTAGVIVGTAAYMAPEQARSKPVDRRADIWAFGCVLYEMLTGRPAFAGETVTDVLAAVVQTEPDWAALPPDTPPHLGALLRRCLAKDPRQRLRDIGDARWELEHGASIEPAPSERAPAQHARLWWAPWLLAAVGAVAAASAWLPAAVPSGTAASSAAPLIVSVAPPAATALNPVGGLASAPEIAPDGSAVLYAAGDGYYVRRLDALQAIRVPGSELASNAAFWWPDSAAVVMPTPTRGLVRVRLPDGAPEPLMPLEGPTRGGTISDEGVLLLSQALGPLLVRAAAGGAVRPVETPGLPPGRYTNPSFLPGGHEFLVQVTPADGSEPGTYLARLDDARAVDAVRLLQTPTAAFYTPAGGGQVLFVRDDNLYAQRLDRRARALVGEPRLLVAGVASQPGNAVHRAEFSVARNGTVAWRAGRAAYAQVTELDREGRTRGVSGPPGSFTSLLLAPDETRVLAYGDDQWLFEVGQPGRLPLAHADRWFAWSADGAALLGLRDGRQVVRWAPDRAAAPEVIGEVPSGGGPTRHLEISPDGTTLMWADTATGALRAARIQGTPEERGARELAAGGSVQGARFSPDGRWIVYTGLDGAAGVYVQPFPGPGRRRQLAPAGRLPLWRSDGREILFTHENAMWSIPVATEGGDLRAGSPVRLFEGLRPAPGTNLSSRQFAVSRDGSRFFLVQRLDQPDSDVIHLLIGGF